MLRYKSLVHRCVGGVLFVVSTSSVPKKIRSSHNLVEVHVRDWQSIVLIGPDPFTILQCLGWWKPPSQTTQPSQPSQTTQPSQPSQPSQTTQPSQPSQPSQTTQPSQPSQPSQLSQPSQTTQPSQPSQTTPVSHVMSLKYPQRFLQWLPHGKKKRGRINPRNAEGWCLRKSTGKAMGRGGDLERFGLGKHRKTHKIQQTFADHFDIPSQKTNIYHIPSPKTLLSRWWFSCSCLMGICDMKSASQPQACCLDYDGNSLSIVSYGTVGTEDGLYEWLGS